jgi:hypothetical protein
VVALYFKMIFMLNLNENKHKISAKLSSPGQMIGDYRPHSQTWPLEGT